MRFPRTLCEKRLSEALVAIEASEPLVALEAIKGARKAFEQMLLDIGEDAPPTQEEIDDFRGYIECYMGTALLELAGTNLLRPDKLDEVFEAIACLSTAVACFERTRNDALSAALVNLGILLRQIGRFDEALKCYEQTIEAFRLKGDEFNLCQTQQNAGNLCQATGRHQEALHYLNQAKDGFDRLGLPEKKSEVEVSIRMTFLQMGEFSKAFEGIGSAQAQPIADVQDDVETSNEIGGKGKARKPWWKFWT